MESILVSPTPAPLIHGGAVSKVLHPQQAASDLGSPLRWAADPVIQAPSVDTDHLRRQTGGRQGRTSPEMTLVATVGQILCFAREEPGRAPQVREKVLALGASVEGSAEVEQPREEEEDAIRAFFGQLWGGRRVYKP